MMALLLGGLALLFLLGGMRAFERASVPTVKALLAWVAALAGLTLMLLLVLTGRGPLAFLALSLLIPLIRHHWQPRWAPWRTRGPSSAGPPPSGSAGQSRDGAPRTGQTMSRDEAYEVLGLGPGAGEAEIQAAYLRLMRGAHPDSGGSAWLATRINQARDVLLRRGR